VHDHGDFSIFYAQESAARNPDWLQRRLSVSHGPLKLKAELTADG
jgi:hypothetical protein